MDIPRAISTSSSLDEISASYDDVPIIDSTSVPKRLLGRKASLDLMMTEVEWKEESRVLVLYTGGTIGMVRNDRGNLAPIPRELEINIRRYPHMHDQLYASNHYGDSINAPLVLPECREARRVVYWVYEYDPLLDSSNMTMDDWIRIAKDIRGVYEMFDGFVVLHGTDTLAYTAAALSFMLENLGKPVIITGSQIPIFETRSDGRDNFVGSVILAGSYTVPEVTVFFNNKLYRGNRTTKVSTGRLQAFDSPNMSPLATAGISIQVEYRSIFRPRTLKKFTVHDRLNRNVGLLTIFPSISTETVRSCLQPPISGVVLQTYGAGNMPTNRTDIMQLLRDATKREVILVNITQCLHGAVDSIYETGQALMDTGVISGHDMTPEAALTKLSYVLSKSNWDYETRKKMMNTNLRGEMTLMEYSNGDDGNTRGLDIFSVITRALRLSSEEDVEAVKDMVIPTVFFTAAVNGDITRLQQVYKSGIEINLQDASGWTALHMVVKDGLIEMVTWLLEHGASVHIRDKMGHSPLTIAVHHNHHKIIKLLVQTGAHLMESPHKIGETLVAAAASDNSYCLTSYMLAGADLSYTDPCGRSPLHAACTVGSESCTKILLAANVPTDVRDQTDLTPVMCAQINNHLNLVDLITSHEEKMDALGR
ncbi:hypothetical protein Pcinc_018876 [Petrolisthes cinctipes]|uniref:asparaginase n=1 Tax=Petrolisthes cinctipes TaxID=88211 RepID=A0AAE1KM90_PETCI|nr:hypothetical protein Pcinc_018876 [Petrolisthes cinctipes]